MNIPRESISMKLVYKFRSQFKKEFRTAARHSADPQDLFAEIWDNLIDRVPLSEDQFTELLPELLQWAQQQRRRSRIRAVPSTGPTSRSDQTSPPSSGENFLEGTHN